MITIPLALPRECEHPNARCHFHAKGRAVKATRAESRVVTQAMMIRHGIWEPLDRPVYKLKFYLSRKRDEDGLIAWVKAQIDGMADAGLFRNDSELRLYSVEQLSGVGSTGGKVGVDITIWSDNAKT